MDKFVSFLKEYRWTVTCALSALVIAILIIKVGFWNTLLLCALVAVGIAVGMTLDKKGSFKNLFGKDE